MSTDSELLARLRSDLPAQAEIRARLELDAAGTPRRLVSEAARLDALGMVDRLAPRLEAPPPLAVLEQRLPGWLTDMPLPRLQALGLSDAMKTRLLATLADWILDQARHLLPPDAMQSTGMPRRGGFRLWWPGRDRGEREESVAEPSPAFEESGEAHEGAAPPDQEVAPPEAAGPDEERAPPAAAPPDEEAAPPEAAAPEPDEEAAPPEAAGPEEEAAFPDAVPDIALPPPRAARPSPPQPRPGGARDRARESMTRSGEDLSRGVEAAVPRNGGGGGEGVARNGGGEAARPDPPERVPAVVSAEGPRELGVGEDAGVSVRIERREEARPLRHATDVVMHVRESIAVILTTHGEAVALADQAMMRMVDPPGPGQAAEVEFAIRGVKPGQARIVVHLQQGSSRLAMLEFGLEVTSSGPGPEARQRVESVAREGDAADHEVLEIIIQESRGAQGVVYTYLVNSRRLDVSWGRFTSPAFASVTAGGAAAPRSFVESIYRRIETEVLENWDDADLLERRLRGIGVSLSDQLLPPELALLLWEGRDNIGTVEVTPFEPWIPWELLRLRKPGTSGSAGVDDRFFAEYRLVRTLSGRSPSDALRRKKWRYVLGDYPNGLYEPAAGERAFLEQTLPGMGVPVETLAAEPGAVLAALESPDFDLIHFACHGTSDLGDIEASSLVLSDRLTADGKVRPVSVVPTDLAGGTNLGERRPLVFLNACQSGRHAPALTDLGGWPKAFLDAGAGAVMGTLWSVHEKPAVSFAETFYRRLVDGATLADATGDARKEARSHGDATWLAYTAYGSPSARMVE